MPSMPLRAESYDPHAEDAAGECGWGVWAVMRVIGRLLLALAVAFPVTVALAAGAGGATGNADGPAVLKCMHWKDSMSISPGVGNSPTSQIAVAHGKVYGCNKAGGGAQYSATLQMSGATCSNLAMSGTASFDWVNGAHSTAFLLFHPQTPEPNKVFVNGSMTSGMFQGLIVSAWLRFTQVFDGNGVNCSPSNLLHKITFTNSQSFQLLTPTVTTTTHPVGPTTTQGHGTTTPTTPPTVPVTNQGSTTAAPTLPPVTIGPQGGGRGGGGGGGRGGGPIVAQSFPTGTLAFTGSSGLAAMFGFEALLVGGALACLDPDRRRRRLARFAYARHEPKSFLRVTLPPMH